MSAGKMGFAERLPFVHLATGLNVIDADQSDIRHLQPPVAPDFLPGGVYAVPARSPVRSAAAKDLADGSSQVRYTVGLGSTVDTYGFDFSGTVSNVDSWLAPGKRADVAHAQLTGLIRIEISQNPGDRTGFWFGDRVGTLHLNPLRTANPCESFSLEVAAYRPGRTRLLSQAAGDGSTTIELYFGESCELRLACQMQVPAGIDPPPACRSAVRSPPCPNPPRRGCFGGLLLVAALRRRTTKALLKAGEPPL